MKRVALILLISLVVIGVGTALFPYDYIVRFEIKTLPEVGFHTFKIWEEYVPDSKIADEELYGFSQKVVLSDKEYELIWSFKSKTDSSATVVVNVNSPEDSFLKKLEVLFLSTQLEDDIQTLLKDYYSKVNEHLDNIRVTIIGETDLPEFDAVYLSMRSSQYGKAAGMMGNYSYLSSFIDQNELSPSGVPFVEVTTWDEEEDELVFNFGFPIANTMELPQHHEFKYKRFYKRKAIKAVFNGNYISSDRAWYTLRRYALDNGYETSGLPIEFFYNNPNFERDEKNWKAEIFLPIN